MPRRESVLGEKLRIKNNLLNHLFEISSLLTSSPDLREVLDKITNSAMNGLNFDRAIVMLLNHDHTRLECKCIQGFTPAGERLAWERPLFLERHDCYETKVVKEGNPRFIPDTERAADVTAIDRVINHNQERTSVLYVPLKIKNKILGLLGVDRFRTRMKITHDDVESLTIFANQAAIIIENARLYQALGDEKALSENIIKCSSNGVIVTDLMGRVLNVNPRAEEILGLPKKRAVTLRIQDIFRFNKRDRKRIYRALKKNEDIQFFDYPYHGEDGNRNLILNLSGFAVRDEHLQTLGAVTIITDLTEKKRMDDYLFRVEKLAAMGRIAAGIAHEIRNPLAGIYTTVQILESDPGGVDTRRTELRNILQEIDRVEHLIREILDLVRAVPLQMEDFDLHELLLTTLALLKEGMSRKNIAWKTEFEMEPCILHADPDRLRQVFLNLIINAMESMNGGGTVTVRTGTERGKSRSRDWLFIDVADTGVGIPSKDMSRIFDPFFTTKNAGTGLGLTVTHKIIEDHRGRIEVESKADGGTTFRVLLPAGRTIHVHRGKPL